MMRSSPGEGKTVNLRKIDYRSNQGERNDDAELSRLREVLPTS